MNKKLKIEEIFDKAFSHHHDGNLDDAKVFYEIILASEPNNLKTNLNLGILYIQAKKFDLAKPILQKLIKIDNKNIHAYNNLGIVLKNLKEFDQAIECYKKVIILDSNFTDAYFNLSLCYKEIKEFKKSKDALEKVIENEPLNEEALHELAVLNYAMGNLQDSKKHYKNILEKDPNNEDANYELGSLYFSSGDLRKSIICNEKVIKINPTNCNAHNNLGVLYKNLGEHENSIKCFKKIISLEPKNTTAYNNLGQVLQELSQTQKAIDSYETALKIKPNDEVAHLQLGLIFYMLKQYKVASKHFALTNLSTSKCYLLNCLFEMNEKSEFLKLLDKTLEAGEVNSMIGSTCLRAEMKYGIVKKNPFCKDPLNYVIKKDLTKIYDFENIFVKSVKNILSKENTVLRNQGLLTNGIQTEGNFLNLESEFISQIREIINKEIENYKLFFKSSEENLIQKFPKEYNLNAWLISMKNGGKLDAHIHENGWLSGSIYINVPPKLKVDSGNLVVCLGNKQDVAENKKIEKSINVVTGSICLFPASLFHYTVPFESDEERIVLAFDVALK